MKEKILEIVKSKKLIKKGDFVGVAVSGGADSVCLLSILNSIKETVDFKLLAIHVNHNIRGKESDGDQKFVEELCKKNGIEVVVKSVDAIKFSKENKMGLEQSARILRYQAFNEVKVEKGLTKIALAHHRNDQAETILMHIFRGCGLQGLIGMTYSHGDFIEPLLEEKREDIENYIKENKLKFVVDSTNFDTDYSRNYVRHKILKDVEKCYPNAVNNIAKMGLRVKQDEEFIRGCMDMSLVREFDNKIELTNKAFTQHPAVLTRQITFCFDYLDALVDVEESHIMDVIRLQKLAVGKKLNMPHGVVVTKSYDCIVFEKCEVQPFEERNFSCDDEFLYNGNKISVKCTTKVELGKDKLVCDLKKIPNTAVWRNIKAGDKFTKFGGGTKNLVKYLTDKKIGSVERKHIVVLADGEKVLVVAGVEISDNIKIDEKTSKVVEISLKQDNNKYHA